MSEWQNEQRQDERPPSLRGRFAVMLAESLEQVEEKYVMGTLSTEDYQAELKDIDLKLGVIGFALANKPWLKTANRV